MSTKSEYVKKFTAEMKENPRKALAGHIKNPTYLNIISERADIIAKFAVLAWNSKARTKYSSGLKPSKDLAIRVYKNFANFNVKARADIEEFVSNMTPENQAKFTNKKNISVIVAQPDNDILDNNEEQIVSGGSQFISFDRAVRADQKTINGIYIMIMVSDTFAEEEGPVPAAPIDTPPAVQTAKFAKKRSKKTALLKRKIKNAQQWGASLQNRKAQLQGNIAGMQMQKKLLNDIYGEDVQAGIAAMNGANKKWREDFKAKYEAASDKDKGIMKLVAKLKANNAKKAEVRGLLRQMDDQELANMIFTGKPVNATRQYNARRKMLKAELEKLTAQVDALYLEIDTCKASGDYAGVRKNKIKLQKTVAAIAKLRGQLETYKDMSPEAFAKKNNMLAEVLRKIEKATMRGEKFSAALDKALNTTPATKGEKQIIKQQIAKQIAEGTAPVYATQQALQDNYDAVTGMSKRFKYGML